MESYMYAGGGFYNIGNLNWEERQPTQTYGLSESSRDDTWITLWDGSRNAWFTLPINGGQSYTMLNGGAEWTAYCTVTYDAGNPYDDETSAIRDKITELANGQLKGQDVYKPSPEELAGYFAGANIDKITYENVLPAAEKAVSSNKAIELWGKPTAWCGVWATSIYRNAGLKVKWKLGTGGGIVNEDENNKQVKLVNSNVDILSGDVAVLKLEVNPQIHHFIVTEVDPENDSITSVDGNQVDNKMRNNTILKRHDHKISDVWYYYTVIK